MTFFCTGGIEQDGIYEAATYVQALVQLFCTEQQPARRCLPIADCRLLGAQSLHSLSMVVLAGANMSFALGELWLRNKFSMLATSSGHGFQLQLG